jgi:hypothetical protein
MKQTTRSIIGALVLLAVALGVAFAAAWAGKDEEKKKEAQAKHEKLFDFDKNHALVVNLVRPGLLVQVARDTPTSPWKLTQPAKDDGDEAKINALLDAFTTLKQKSDLGDDHDLKAYGLEHSKIVAKVVFDDGHEEGLEFGVENNFDHGIYAKKLNENLVRVLDTWQKNPFDKTAYDLRNKMVAQIPSGAEITRLEVTGNKTPYTLEKEGAAWKVNGKPAFKLAMAGEFALDPPQLTVKIDAKNGQEKITRSILFSPTRAGVGQGQTIAYAKRADEPQVYELENLVVNDLDKSADDMADKQLVHVSSDGVTRLAFEGAEGKIEVSRTRKANTTGGFDDTFAVVSPKPGPANKVKLSAALFALTNLRATTFEALPKDPAKVGLNKPMIATLFGEGDKVLARVKVGGLTKDGKQRYVLVDGADKLALVEKNVVEDMPWTAASALEVASK